MGCCPAKRRRPPPSLRPLTSHCDAASLAQGGRPIIVRLRRLASTRPAAKRSSVPETSSPPSPAATDAALYLATALHALAREEQAGRRTRRLLDPGLATWQRFRGRLGPRDLAELLLEDAAVTQPQPFDAATVLGRDDPFRGLPDSEVERWMREAASFAPASLAEELDAHAARLGLLKARPAYSELHQLQTHHRALELPGSGGRLAAHIVETQPEIFLKDVFTIACATWQERMLAGLVAVGLGVVGDVRIAMDADLALARRAEGGFTHVFGLRPEKGGRFAADQLEGWFHEATIVLV